MEGRMNYAFHNGMINIKVSQDIYSLDAVLGACYLLLDKAYIFLDNEGKGGITVRIKSKKKAAKRKMEEMALKFQNELLNQTVRIRTAKMNKKVREYIISQALFSTSPAVDEEKDRIEKELEGIMQEIEDKDYLDDPLGIAVPWEEKYGKKQKETAK